jgi:hypothetical protein
MNNKLIMNRMLNKENKKTLCLCASVSLCLHNREDKKKFVDKKLFADTNKNQYSLFNTLLPMEI